MSKDPLIFKDKLSKKERKRLNARKRVTWDFSPVSRVIPNKKKLAQAKKPRPGREDSGWGIFCIQ